jgi:ABC-2 type transport system permease protein
MKGHMYWSVRRELWENRSIYVAPFVIAALALFGFLTHLGKLAEHLRRIGDLPAPRQMVDVVMPYGMLASAILFVGVLVAVFYCADALNGERRDRSILFWKSMPVSDRVTVLSKALVAIAVVPLIAYAFALATQVVMLAVSSAVLAAKGIDPSVQLSRMPLAEMPVVMLYGVVAHALWYAPIYAWLLLASAWARRAPLLWAALPFFAAFVMELIALGSSHVLSLLRYRITGAMSEAFAVDASKTAIVHLSQLDPAKFLSSPGLWLGLLFAVACLAIAIRVRRYREPN